MLPAFLVGGLSGCSMPFAILMLVAIASLFLSTLIGADDIPMSSNNVHRSSTSNSRNAMKNSAFVHHSNIHSNMHKVHSNNRIKTNYIQQSSNNRLRMIGDDLTDLTPVAARLDRQDEVLSPPVNHLNNPDISKHYACPPTSLELLRKRYGTRQSLWGEWSNAETRTFYRTQLPRALQIDGALGLTLEERAQLASEARHALRVYSRERCYLPGRVAARIYDGLRHFQLFGYWSCDGMNWTEVKEKYARDARQQLGENALSTDIEMFVYRKIVDRACATNAIFDHYASQGTIEKGELFKLIKGIFAVEKIKSSRPPRKCEKAVIIEELEKQLEDERTEAMYARRVPDDTEIFEEEIIENNNILNEITSQNKNENLIQNNFQTFESTQSMSLSILLPLNSNSKSYYSTINSNSHSYQITSSSDSCSNSSINLNLKSNSNSNIISDKLDDFGRKLMEIVSTAMGKGEELKYLIESHVNLSPFL